MRVLFLTRIAAFPLQMGWNSLSLSSKSTSSSSSSTVTTTPILTPTSPKKSLQTVTTSHEEAREKESLPVQTEQRKDTEKPSDDGGITANASKQNERDSPPENGQDSPDSVKIETDSQTSSAQSISVSKLQPEEKGAVTEDSRQVIEDNGDLLTDGIERTESEETKDSQTATSNIPSSDQPEVETMNAGTNNHTLDASDNKDESEESHVNIPADVLSSQPASRLESIMSSDSQASVINSSSEHLPIIKGKRSMSSPNNTLEAVEKANKENLERTSKYDSHHGRRSISSGTKSKVEKMKARKEQASQSTLRKSTSMSDLREGE